MEINVDDLKKIGGREWKKGDHHRIYFNDLENWFDQASNENWTLNNKKVTRKIFARKATAKFFYNVIDENWNWSTDELTEDEVDILIKNIKAAITPVVALKEEPKNDLRKKAEETGQVQILSKGKMKTTLIAETKAGIEIKFTAELTEETNIISEYELHWHGCDYYITIEKDHAEKLLNTKLPAEMKEAKVLLQKESAKNYKKLLAEQDKRRDEYLAQKSAEMRKQKWEKTLRENGEIEIELKTTGHSRYIAGLPPHLDDKEKTLIDYLYYNNKGFFHRLTVTELLDLIKTADKAYELAEKKSMDAFENLKKTAATTGKRQKLDSYTTDTNDRDRYFDLDITTRYINPDGSISEETNELTGE